MTRVMKRSLLLTVTAGVLLLAVFLPLSSMFVEYRVTEALVQEAHYHAGWLGDAERKWGQESGVRLDYLADGEARAAAVMLVACPASPASFLPASRSM